MELKSSHRIVSDERYEELKKRLKEFLRKEEMNREELKEQWLSAFPESSHSCDTKRFIRYAIELAKVNGSLDYAEMEARGISPHRIAEYQCQFEFLRDVLEVLDEK